MKLDFKRIMSAVLALTMMVSSLVMVNVVSISAATLTMDFNDTDVQNAIKDTTKEALVTKAKTVISGIKSYFTVNFNGAREITADSINGGTYILGGSTSDYVQFTTTTPNAILTIKFAAKDNKKRQIAFDTSCSDLVSPAETEKDSVTGTTPDSIKYNLSKASTYKFSFQNINLYSVSVEESAAKSTTWKFVDSTTDQKFASTVTLASPTDVESTIITYTGTDYTLNPDKVTLTKNSNGVKLTGDNEYTFTLTNDLVNEYFFDNIHLEKENIEIAGGANRVLHLYCSIHKTVYSIKLDDQEPAHAKGMLVPTENGGYTTSEDIRLPLHEGKYAVTVAGGTLTLEDGTSDFDLQSAESKLKGSFEAVDPVPISGSTGEIRFNQLKVSSETLGERLLGGTVLDFNDTKHFFVTSDLASARSETVFALSKDISSTDMIAAVIRCDTDSEDGIGFKLAENDDPNISYELKVYCTAVKDIKSDGTDTTIGLMEINPETYKKVELVATTPTVKVTETSQIDEQYWQKDISFTGLKPGKAYSIYNPGNVDDNGNLRIFAVELVQHKKTEASGNWYYNWTTDEGDKEQHNITRKGETATGLNASIGGETYTKGLKSNSSLSITFTPVNDGQLIMYFDVANGKNINVNGSPEAVNENKVTVDVKAGTPYTISKASSNGTNFNIVYIEVTGQSGPAKATISGSVKETAKLEAKEHTNKADLDKGEKNNDRVAYANNTETSGSVEEKAVTDAKVTISSDKLTEEKTVTVQENGSFSFDNDGALEDGTYTVKAAKGGKTIGTKVITVTDGVADQTADFVLDNTVAVTLTTDIKDYKTAIKLTSGSSTITISDVTYHYIPSLATTKGDVARTESITHYFKAPAGTYNVAFSSTSDRFEIQDRNGNKLDSITIGENGVKNQTVRLYIAPKDKLTVSYTDKANSLKPVQKGIYRFIRQSNETPDNAISAAIKFKSTDGEHGFEDDTEHMYAEGKYSAFKEGAEFTDGYEKQENDGRIKISKDSGYVVFKLDKGDSYIAKIKTSTATCVLERVDGTGTINGNRTVISVDSRFDTTAIPITGGTEGSTYVLASNTPSTSEANVESIEFDVASPFEVTEARSDESINNGKIVIGKFDMTGIDEDALNNYTTFAILVAEDKDALKWAALNGTISKSVKPTDGDPITTSTDESGQVVSKKHETNGHIMTVPTNVDGTTVKVLRDETKEVFKKILNDEGGEIVPADGNYYYAVVVQNISKELYAVGAAKSTESGNWTVQGTPITINAN